MDAIPWDVVFTSLLIVAARVIDVSLGTLRTVSIMHGRRALALALGFVEILVWVLVVSEVIGSIKDNLVYGLAYAGGFALGTWLGMTIEQRLAMGTQVLRVFTRQGDAMAASLRELGHRVTVFDGRGRNGPVSMLFVQSDRRRVGRMLATLRSIDPECYYTVDDIRLASIADAHQFDPRMAAEHVHSTASGITSSPISDPEIRSVLKKK